MRDSALASGHNGGPPLDDQDPGAASYQPVLRQLV